MSVPLFEPPGKRVRHHSSSYAALSVPSLKLLYFRLHVPSARSKVLAFTDDIVKLRGDRSDWKARVVGGVDLALVSTNVLLYIYS